MATKLHSRLRGHADWTRVDRFLERLSEQYPPFDQANLLRELCRAGLVELRQGAEAATPAHIKVVEAHRLEDLLDPGRRQRIEDAKAWARSLSPNPGVSTKRLNESLETFDAWPPDAIRALAVLCLLQDLNVKVPLRTASSWFFGDTKVLEDHVDRASAWLGGETPIHFHEPMCFLGGSGEILAPIAIQFGSGLAFLAVPRGTVQRLDVKLPARGLAVIEGKTCFEKACQGRIAALQGMMCLWSGGQPGPDVKRIVSLASAQGVPIQVWYDLDGEGVLAARLVNAWANDSATAFAMDVQTARSAPIQRTLTGSKWKTAKLQSRQTGFLQELADHLAESHTWIEQETLLEAKALAVLRAQGIPIGASRLEESEPTASTR